MDTTIDQNQLAVIKQWLGSGSINIFGPQYAGKDTQGEVLVKAFGAAPLIGGGDILRGSIVPEHVKNIMNQGQLIPTKDYIEIVLPYLAQPDFNGKPLILSAVGRWHGEEQGVLDVTTKANHPLKAVIYMTLSEEIIWQRWEAYKGLRHGGTRQDESKEALEMRLKEFSVKTLPVVEFYRDMGILIEVDGSGSKEKVFADIIDGLGKFAQV